MTIEAKNNLKPVTVPALNSKAVGAPPKIAFQGDDCAIVGLCWPSRVAF
jgi:hypothetical protein